MMIILANDQAVGAIIEILINLGIPLFVIVMAMVVGSMIEKAHYKDIHEREARFAALPAIPSQNWDADREVADSRMVTGSVVVSFDYFKRFLAGLRNIIGGRIRSYESLIDRGRREAILRMKEEYPDADIIVNFRIETSSIARQNSNGKKNVGAVELVAYGTAIKYAKN